MRRPSLSPLRLSIISEAPEHECEAPIKIDLGPGSPTSNMQSPLPDSPGQSYSAYSLNLGAESPDAVLKSALGDSPRQMPADEWRKNGIAVPTNVPMRKRSWRSSSFSEKLKRRPPKLKLVYNDCGICGDLAIMPCKMLCCSKLFCLEHISDWLYGPTSDGRCPSCKTLCNFVPSSHKSSGSPSTPVETNPDSPTKTDRPVIFLLMQPSSSSSPESTPRPQITPRPDSPIVSSSGANTPRPLFARKEPALDSQSPSYHSNSPIVVLLGRMIGRILSIVGLILFLFVLLS